MKIKSDRESRLQAKTEGSSPADYHKLTVAGLDAEVLVDIYGEQRTGAVKYRGQVTHQRSQHYRQHYTFQSCTPTRNEVKS